MSSESRVACTPRTGSEDEASCDQVDTNLRSLRHSSSMGVYWSLLLIIHMILLLYPYIFNHWKSKYAFAKADGLLFT